MKNHKEKIYRGVHAINNIKYDIGKDFAKETRNNFLRKQMSSEIVSTLEYQSQKKEAIRGLDLKNRPQWIKTNIQKSRYLEIMKDPSLRTKVSFPKDKDEVIFKINDHDIIVPNKMLGESDLSMLFNDFPDLKLGEDIVVKDGFPYFSLEAIDLISKSGSYNIPTISDFRKIAGLLSNTTNIASSYAYIPMVCELFNFKYKGFLDENNSVFNEELLYIGYDGETKGKASCYALLVGTNFSCVKNIGKKNYYPLVADKK